MESTLAYKTTLKSDEQLFAAVSTFDCEIAFGTLYKRYYRRSCEQARQRVQCQYLAREITSEVFIKIWKKRASIFLQGKFYNYLSRSIRNQCVDHLRIIKRHRDFNCDLDVDCRDNCRTILENLQYTELEQKIETVVSKLPAKGQLVFRLSREEGLKYHEIAERLNISTRTVETHIRRSLAFIRSHISERRA